MSNKGLKTIYTSQEHMTVCGPNASFGNHILHLLFCLNLSSLQNLNLRITTDSNLDEIFDLSEYKCDPPEEIVNLFDEEWGGDIEIYKDKDRRNLLSSLNLLYNKQINFPDNFWVGGWFHNTPLFPSYEIFKTLKFKKELLESVRNQQREIINNTSICLHYRGTDFANYPNEWGDVRISLDYYIECLEHMVNNYEEITKVYIFTEDINFLTNIPTLQKKFPLLDFEYSANLYFIDWLTLHLAKNIICSNSTFCLTAAIYNKTVIYQPKNFLFRDTPYNMCFPTAPFFLNSHIL
jgi:hypothetical protein